MSVLRDNNPVHGQNKGFMLKDNRMLSYAQSRAGLTSLYAKRRVLDDGVSATHLDSLYSLYSGFGFCVHICRVSVHFTF